MLGTLSIIPFIPTAKNFQNFQNQRTDEEPSFNRAKKNIYTPDTPNQITENSSSESQQMKLLEKKFLNQFSYYIDDPVSSSKSEVPDLEPTATKTPRIIPPGSKGSFYL